MKEEDKKDVVCGLFILAGALCIIIGVGIQFSFVVALITLGIFLILTGFLGGD